LEEARNDAKSAVSAPLVPPNKGAYEAKAIYQTVSRMGILGSSA
jgi:hypothetical protein